MPIEVGDLVTAELLGLMLNLPDDEAASVNSQITITSGTFAAIPSPGPLTVTFDNPSDTYDLIVDVSYSAWMAASANDVRVGVAASGGVSFTPTAFGTGGQIMQSDNLIASTSSVGQQGSFPVTIPAGAATVTFALQAMRTTSGTQTVSYPTLRVAARRFIVP